MKYCYCGYKIMSHVESAILDEDRCECDDQDDSKYMNSKDSESFFSSVSKPDSLKGKKQVFNYEDDIPVKR